MTIRRLVPTLAIAIAATFATPCAGFAQTVSVDGGYLNAGGNSSTGAALSLQLFKTPVLPLSIDATALASLAGHGYAATADGRFRLGGTTVGAGVGVGNLGDTTKNDFLYDAILAQSILPHVSVEARYYFVNNHTGSLFAGLRFSF